MFGALCLITTGCGSDHSSGSPGTTLKPLDAAAVQVEERVSTNPQGSIAPPDTSLESTVPADTLAPPVVTVATETTTFPPDSLTPNDKDNSTKTSLSPLATVTIRGAKSSAGVYFCGIFDDAQKLARRVDPVLSDQIAVSKDPVAWHIDSLPPGEYAIAVFHDANENGKLDRHPLGFPIEAYGFSNNARGKFGPPPYDKVKFVIGDAPLQMQIDLK